ncbi:DJ-1/PfpI family protein [bacterium]|nr:DJ-1/PfpI family protein [bacterium]
MSQIIEFVIFPGALGLDITGPLEVFHTASAIIEQKRKENTGYKTRFAGANKGPVRLSSGLEIVANATFKDMSSADILLVPGGSDVSKLINDYDFMDYILKRSKQVKRIISVCKGAFILAAAGLLDGKQATTHWRVADELAKRYPKVKVRPDALFIHEDNIYTSAGVTAGIDLALALVEEDFGVSIAIEVARLLVLYYRRPGSQSQFSTPLKAQEAAGKRFSDLHNWLVDNLGAPISVEQMAEYSTMSQRNFTRVFKIKTGMTPNKYLETLRLDRAREIMVAGNESLDRIAEISGFGREERLRRAFLRRFGVTPSQYCLHFIQS